MDYLMHFKVEGLHDTDKVAMIKKELHTLQGVKDVQITGVDRVSITYDSTKVIPSQLTYLMRKLGVKTHSG
ncbi:heavy-metal-associated domain-containing protein [Pelotomaculum isophthalicicum JI]|uniref:Heavy-metal-associated domain-containing protein n=1 Tax=Pelotomaculum isophthalicicum JI TaxID=947010 RepID=A0A9X4JT73_9FIRM|nr:heavy-metal-associated domain-containing protein [Pelotomaculum isophthalicicum]MDF9407000.1 heavy-metal-associated domain-containing protein [Pelotomaculum isophthalicicum JI]